MTPITMAEVPTGLVGAALRVFGWIGGFFQSYRRRNALQFKFETTGGEPSYRRQTIWSGDNSATRLLYCVGVTNKFSEPLTARVIVEQITREQPPLRPERALRVHAGADGQSETSVSPSPSISLFELAEMYKGTDMAYICYAQPAQECYVGRDTRILLRLEGGGGVRRMAFRVKTHALHGRLIPFSVEPDDAPLD